MADNETIAERTITIKAMELSDEYGRELDHTLCEMAWAEAAKQGRLEIDRINLAIMRIPDITPAPPAKKETGE